MSIQSLPKISEPMDKDRHLVGPIKGANDGRAGCLRQNVLNVDSVGDVITQLGAAALAAPRTLVHILRQLGQHVAQSVFLQ